MASRAAGPAAVVHSANQLLARGALRRAARGKTTLSGKRSKVVKS